MLTEHIFDEDDERTRRNLARLKKHLGEKATKVSPVAAAELNVPDAGASIVHTPEPPPADQPPVLFFAAGLAQLEAHCPANVDEKRWRQAVADAGRFQATWGGLASGLGWTADDLFGLHPVAPLARYDAMGLVWLLRGREVVGLDTTTAQIRASPRPYGNCRLVSKRSS
jgi:hypothetical protein